MPSELHTERRDSTLVLTISAPDSRNALSEQVFAAGVEALDVAESDPTVRCIVLRGDSANFCSGGHPQDEMLAHLHDFVEVLRVFPKPVIAAVEGAAAGGGFSLALACDLIVAADDAKFTFSHDRLGGLPDGGASRQLMLRLPRNLALQMLCLPEPMTAQQLHAHGLVNWLARRGEALTAALEISQRLAQCPPDTVASVKELINQCPER